MPAELARARALRPPALLAAVGVLAQISYPLVHGSARAADTIAVVVLIGGACVAHSFLCGLAVPVIATTVVGGFLVEVVGVHSGLPFGHYAYGSSLGPKLWDVPLVIALAWPMIAWPAALAARRLVIGTTGRIVLGAWALATWDLFLDPQMVAAGRWRWRDPSPHLPGIPHVPITNYLGWLGVSVLMSLVLQLTLRAHPANDRGVPVPLYVWTWASSALALAAFLDLAGAALWGGVAMGTVAVPLLVHRARR